MLEGKALVSQIIEWKGKRGGIKKMTDVSNFFICICISVLICILALSSFSLFT